jgi:HPt (histidine-containing phosphotransfer) domain-containing protein
MSFEKMMEGLRAEYVQSLPKKMDDIQSHLSVRDTALLRDDFHKLKGTGKTYGIPEISQLGEAVEKICKNKSEQALEIIPLALSLLALIHQKRSHGQMCLISDNPQFARIQKLAEGL